MRVDTAGLKGGQKNGFLSRPMEQHAAVAKYAAGKRVLDAFCNQGSFALDSQKPERRTCSDSIALSMP
ncbi:MAG: hypothetical protein U5L01_06935 [Rheinheimera sp.]|nr:hypothetical protein [Rheinheimera sp.]